MANYRLSDRIEFKDAFDSLENRFNAANVKSPNESLVQRAILGNIFLFIKNCEF